MYDVRSISPGRTTPSKPERMSRVAGCIAARMLLTIFSGLSVDPNVSWYDAAAPSPTTRRFWKLTPSSRILISDSDALRVLQTMVGKREGRSAHLLMTSRSFFSKSNGAESEARV